VFALGAFAYVSWVFPGDGWSFLAAPTESLAGWAVDAGDGWTLRSDTGDLAVQYEHTLVATRRGPVVVTLAGA